MSTVVRETTGLPPEQQAIRDKCYHPTGEFSEFQIEELEQSLHSRFEEQVRLFPSRLAIKSDGHQLTYDELNKAANRLSRLLLSRYAQREGPIALLFEKGNQVTVAMLAVLKAGKVFVLLDHSFPFELNSYTLQDSQPSLIISNESNLSLAHELAQDFCDTLNLDEIDTNLPEDNPDLDISPDDLACIIYTSGSTGEPKGVVRNHRGLLFNVLNQAKRADQEHLDRMLRELNVLSDEEAYLLLSDETQSTMVNDA